MLCTRCGFEHHSLVTRDKVERCDACGSCQLNLTDVVEKELAAA